MTERLLGLLRSLHCLSKVSHQSPPHFFHRSLVQASHGPSLKKMVLSSHACVVGLASVIRFPFACNRSPFCRHLLLLLLRLLGSPLSCIRLPLRRPLTNVRLLEGTQCVYTSRISSGIDMFCALWKNYQQCEVLTVCSQMPSLPSSRLCLAVMLG